MQASLKRFFGAPLNHELVDNMIYVWISIKIMIQGVAKFWEIMIVVNAIIVNMPIFSPAFRDRLMFSMV